MMTFVTFKDFILIIPELILVVTAVMVLIIDLVGTQVGNKITSPILAIVGLCLGIISEIFLFGETSVGFFNTIVADEYSILFEIIYMVAGILTIMISWHYIAENNMNFREYYILLLFSIVGMMFMTSSTDLLMIFIGLEIMSISTYIMVGMLRHSPKSNEAALKYLLLGAFSTGFLLYGIALIYGATGSTQLPQIVDKLQQTGVVFNPLVGFSLAFIVIGVGFKIAIVPFHMWVPDVYSGAPTPVTAFMSAASKAAGFAVLIRIFLTGIPLDVRWYNLIWILAILTMSVGNLMALKQNSVKRMLAYSSIAHAGYVMVAFVVGSEAAISGIIFYSFAYALMGIGAFGVLSIKSKGQTLDTFEDLSGYAYKGSNEKIIALLMCTFMFSMIGLPLTGGFIGKFQIFYVALESGWVWLTVIAVINSIISIFYYLRVVVYMYMKEPTTIASPVSPTQISMSPVLAITGLIGTAAAVLLIGIFPSPLLKLASTSVKMIAF